MNKLTNKPNLFVLIKESGTDKIVTHQKHVETINCKTFEIILTTATNETGSQILASKTYK